MNECGARTKAGKPCKRAGAGAGGRCYLHGGASPGRPCVTGRYSTVHRRSLAEKMHTFSADPTPGELWQELALQRALLDEYLDRFPDGRALPADDIERLFGWLESIGKQTERIHRIMAQTALTVAEVNYLQAALGDLLRKYLPDDDRRALLDELKSVTGGKMAADDDKVTKIVVEYRNASPAYTNVSPDNDEDVAVYMPDNGRG